MLQEVRIKDFIIVDTLAIRFTEGLNVVTGETGAGKSIIVSAIEMLLGSRGSSELVRPSAKEAIIEGVFLIKEDTKKRLQELGLSDDETMIVRRSLSPSGKSRVYVNDSPVTLQTLQRVTADLVDLHGQHEHQSLFKPSSQLQLLDAFAGTEELVRKVQTLYKEYMSLKRELEEMREKSKERQHRIDLLSFQIKEIESASLKEGELEELLSERKILQNLSQLRALSEEAMLLLKESDTSILGQLGSLTKTLEELSRLDEDARGISAFIKEAETLLQEASYSLRDLKDRYDCDPQRLDEVESRLSLIDRLRKKYGDNIREILDYKREAEQDLQRLYSIDEKTEFIEKRLKELSEGLEELTFQLSERRKETARILQKEIERVLYELAFKNSVFIIDIKEIPLSATGRDSVEFLFSANPGHPPKALSKVASGGEISRVMLALKSLLASFDKVPLMVFDEVDAGIGGMTAESVARKLKFLSRTHQVICITHLPQIASKADHHLLVDKEEDSGGTRVRIRELDYEQRLREIARMLSGSVTDASLQHARELLSMH
jgi:DNA repair protein RecN (Recombination protein N)